ncbi:putative photosynthetic complex assembly protein PuhE [Roseovarius aquimarinus]|uniref:Photosynthetic complex assembly protein PuhE n=1 Tax=Roseovarius aquimarinus TaxID=1229156 RepID=A0ABW7I2U8_9RHOB
MAAEIWIAAFVALFVWWFSTGAILVAVRRAERHGRAAHVANTALGLPLLVLGCAMIGTAGPGIAGVYSGFLGALAIWAWIELAFLSGVITGPERRACPERIAPLARFVRAWRTVAHHELALLAGLLAVAALGIWQGAGQANGPGGETALWTYLILFIARISAKLNLFAGAPRINTEFVPKPLAHLPSYFRQGPVTLIFPVSITVLSFAVACFLRQLWLAESDPAIVAATLLTALSALALAEHWLMVVPLPDAKLWRWMLPSPSRPIQKEGKTHGL